MSDEERGQPPPPDPSRARTRGSVTDDDVRRELRGSAFKAASLLGVLMEPILDPRSFDGGEVPNAVDLHRIQNAAEKAIGAWSRTCEAPKDAPPELPADREARLERLMSNPDVRAWIVKRLGETTGTEAANPPPAESPPDGELEGRGLGGFRTWRE